MIEQLELFTLTLPAPRINWACYTKGLQIVLRHASGLRLTAETPEYAERAMTAAEPWLTALDGWHVVYDAAADGDPRLHAYTAISDTYAPVSGATLPDLAFHAWMSSMDELSLPDVSDATLRALFVRGWRWNSVLFVRGYEQLDPLEMSEEQLLWEAQQ